MSNPPLGIDFAWTKPRAAAAKVSGYVFGLGYLSTDPSKNLTAAVIADFHGQEMPVGMFWETTIHAAEGGAYGGVRDATAAYAQAHALGAPAGVCIFFAVDEDVQVGLIAPYFQAIAQTASNWNYRHGVYGSLTVVEGVLAHGWATLGCQTSAWSNGQVSPRAALYQRQSHTRPPIVGVPSNSYDEEVQLASDAGLWLPDNATPPPAQPPAPVINRTQVAAIQRAVHVPADGRWGPQTDGAAMTLRAAAFQRIIPLNHTPGCVALQRAVGTVPDGIWGPNSQAALTASVRALQGALGVSVDGVWGPETDHWFAICRFCDNGK